MSGTNTAAVVSAGSFAVSPELATAAFEQLTQVQDVVGEMVREATVLGRTVPLGGGYAAEIGEFMARYGIDGPGSAADQLTEFGRQLQRLKDDISKSLRAYKDTDDEAAGGVDCHGG